MKRKLLAALLALSLLIPAGCGSSGTGSDVDIDLTKLSATMVYSEVFNMLYTPEDYLGKTVNMEGTFTEYYDNGVKHTQGAFHNRVRHGKWQSWTPQGKLYYSVIFENGHKVKEIYAADPKKRPF